MENEVRIVLMILGVALAVFLAVAGVFVLHGDNTVRQRHGIQKKGRLGSVLVLLGAAVAGAVFLWYFKIVWFQ